jgi:hypothetical protein
MQKEFLSEGLMNEFESSFSDEGWVEDEKGNLMLESEDGKSVFRFIDYGKDAYEWDKELILQIGDDAYRLQESILTTGVEYYFRMPTYKKWQVNEGEGPLGPVYGPGGTMSINKNLNNLPLRIDLNKTMELFIKQAINKDFSIPVLIEA